MSGSDVGTRPSPTTDVVRRARRARVSVTRVGWSPAHDLTFKGWLEQGRRLGVAGRGAGWWLGDWVRYGAIRYGGKYARAGRVTGYDHKTLANMVYVASRFELSRRREDLSWSHHAELAALDVEDQERWLDRIQAERLTVRRLRQELAREPRSHRRDGRAVDDNGASGRHKFNAPGQDNNMFVVCPNCGHRLSASTRPARADERDIVLRAA
jgi:hypothetical protein